MYESQFALSQELAKLRPLNLAASRGSEAVMDLARSLQSSGSDIVVEEDLAHVFGRVRVADALESTFRSEVEKSRRPQILTDNIKLVSGAGPTVNRALAKGEREYFSTVVQCSFLASLHDKRSLAGNIIHSLEKEVEGAPSHHQCRAIPSQDSIYGVLQACEEQTASFQWASLLRQVQRKLRFDQGLRMAPLEMTPLPPEIFRAMLLFAPLVQKSPDEKELLIRMGVCGVCALVVWAHHILGLNVHIRERNFGVKGHEERSTLFGKGRPSISVDIVWLEGNEKATATLLEASTKEILFTMTADSDDFPLEAAAMRPAVGYGRYYVERGIDLCLSHQKSISFPSEKKESVVHEVEVAITALALRVARHLLKRFASRTDTYVRRDSELDVSKAWNTWAIGDKGFPLIIDAARFIFNNDRINTDNVGTLYNTYKGRSIRNAELPYLIQMTLQPPENPGWIDMQRTTKNLIVLLLTFAHVKSLDSAVEFPLSTDLNCLEDAAITMQIWDWDGHTPIHIGEGCWFETFELLLLGERAERDRENLCRTALVSHRGWSIYLSTFGASEPSSISAGPLHISPGVPERNGIRKHYIVDPPPGPRGTGKLHHRIPAGPVSLEPSGRHTFNQSWCNERGDSFQLGLRLLRRPPSDTDADTIDVADSLLSTQLATQLSVSASASASAQRSGYRELHNAIWLTRRSEPCRHPALKPAGPGGVKLPPGCELLAVDCEAQLADFPEVLPPRSNTTSIRGSVSSSGSGSGSGAGAGAGAGGSGGGDGAAVAAMAAVYLCPTAFDRVARWRALVSLYRFVLSHDPQRPPCKVLLRRSGTCFDCTVEQARGVKGVCVVVL